MATFKVHYSDGSHHAGVATFTSLVDAQLFIRTIAQGGYLAHMEEPKARMVRAAARAKAKADWLGW